MRLAFKVLILALAVPNNLASPNPKPSDRLTDCAANNKWEHGCDDIENICQISCAKNVEGQKCENPCDGTSEITYDEMVATKCEEICNASKDDSAEPEHCRFWRWEVVGGDEKRCTLMTADQCQVHKHCGTDSCLCGDVGCPGGEEPADKQSCTSGITYNDGPTMIHWACIPDSPSPYNPGTPMPADSSCFTTQRCSEWAVDPNLMLKVKCDGTAGEWVRDESYSTDASLADIYREVIGAGDVPLNEHDCSPEPKSLVVTIEEDAGAQLSCTTVGEGHFTGEGPEYTIFAPNKCVLICDFHLGMTIEGRLTEDTGEFGFFIVETGDNITEDPSRVTCWGGAKRKE